MSDTQYPPAGPMMVRFINELVGTVLRIVAEDDPDLAEAWIELINATGRVDVGPPERLAGWRTVSVDGTQLLRLAPHPDPGRFLVRIRQRGLTHELELELTPDPPGGVS